MTKKLIAIAVKLNGKIIYYIGFRPMIIRKGKVTVHLYYEARKCMRACSVSGKSFADKDGK